MSKFKIWIDDNFVFSNCQASDVFAEDSQREKGFRSGTGASAIRVNTALRQANLIAVALVNALGIPDTYDLTSKVEDIENWFKSTQLFKLTDLFEVGTENKLNASLQPATNNSIDLGIDSKRFRTIYATTFHGALSGTAALAIDYVVNGGIDLKIKNIEGRLDELGFKSGVITFAGVNYGSENYTDTTENGIYRQGNFVFCKVYIHTTTKFSSNMFGTLPVNFRPKEEVYFTVFASAAPLSNPSSFDGCALCKIATDGSITIVRNNGDGLGNWTQTGLPYAWFNFGYEAAPITE